MLYKDIAGLIKGIPASAVTAVTAGGSGDNTEVNGLSINTAAYDNRFDSIVFQIAAQATLAQTETLVVTANLQESDDDGNGAPAAWADVAAPAVVLTLTGATGGSTERGVAELGLDLSKSKQWVRVQFTPNASASGTDTASLVALANLSGAQVNPV